MKLRLVVLAAALCLGAGCDLYPDLDASSVSADNLTYDSSLFTKGSDDYGTFLKGSGTITHKTKLSDSGEAVRIDLLLSFNASTSTVTVLSHASTDLLSAFELTLTRQSDTLRATAELEGESKSLGIIADGVDDWSAPITITVTVDNSGDKPTLSVTASSTKTYTPDDGYPEGTTIALSGSNYSVYTFNVSEQ